MCPVLLLHCSGFGISNSWQADPQSPAACTVAWHTVVNCCFAQADVARAIKEECEGELAVAMPILEDALAALDTIKEADITYIRKLGNPPGAIKLVMEVCHCIVAHHLKMLYSQRLAVSLSLCLQVHLRTLATSVHAAPNATLLRCIAGTH